MERNNMAKQTILEYITQEQAEALSQVEKYDSFPKFYDSTYYRGYFNGYLAALYNLKLKLTTEEVTA